MTIAPTKKSKPSFYKQGIRNGSLYNLVNAFLYKTTQGKQCFNATTENHYDKRKRLTESIRVLGQVYIYVNM